jgi:hypothetical protein
VDDREHERTHGDVPDGVGPELFREHLQQVTRDHAGTGAQIKLQEETLFLEDIQAVDDERVGGRSQVRLRNGLIIGGLTGAAIVAALATVRFRRRHQR